MPLADPGNLAALAAAPNRIIACLVEFNWLMDTDYGAAGTWLDESGHIETIEWHKTRKAPQQAQLVPGEGDPWTLTLTLENGSGRFSAGRTDSPLTASILHGMYAVPVRAWAGFMEYAPVANDYIGAAPMLAGDLSVTLRHAGFLAAGMVLLADSELMVVTSVISATRGTVQRGFRNTTPAPHVFGTNVYRAGGLAPVFTGIVLKPSEDPLNQTISLECYGREHLLTQDLAYSPVYTDMTEDQVIASLLALLPASPPYMPVPPAQQTLAPGLTVQPYAFLHNESIWSQCCQLAAAAGGWFYLNELGQAIYENAQAWLGKAATWTFDATEMENVKPVPRYEDVFTSVTVNYSDRVAGPLAAVYSSTRWFSVPPGGTLALELDLSVPAINVVQPVGGALPNTHKHDTDDLRDYTAMAGNRDITGSVTVTGWTVYGQHVSIVFSNASTYAADITRMNIRGQPLVGGPLQHVVVTRTPVPANLPKRDKLISSDQRYNWYLMSEAQALGLATLLADYLCRERFTYPITNARLDPLMQIGDRVTLSWAQPFTADKTGFVLEINGRITGINTLDTLAQMDAVVLDDANLFGSANFHTVGTNLLGDGSVLWY